MLSEKHLLMTKRLVKAPWCLLCVPFFFFLCLQVVTNGDISKLTAQLAKRLGRVVLGLTPQDLEKLNLDNIDIIAALGKWKEWSEDQVYILLFGTLIPFQLQKKLVIFFSS